MAAVKYTIYLVIIIGVIVYLVGVYQHMDEWDAQLSGTPQVSPIGPTALHLEIPVKIYNPDGDVLARLVYYKVYVEGYYAGDGFIPYLDLKSGWSEHIFKVDLDLSRAGCGLAKALQAGSELTVRVEGYAMVDLKAFGIIPWKTVTVPFNVTATNVTLPGLPAEARAFLALTSYVCDHSGDVMSLIQLLEQTVSTSNLTTPPKSNLTAPLNISVEGSPTPPIGYNITVKITNTGEEPVKIITVTVNGVPVLTTPRDLQPGESITLSTRVLTTPAVIIAYTDHGSATALYNP